MDLFDPERIGLAVSDDKGNLVKKWGLAQSAHMAINGGDHINPVLMGLVRSAVRGQSVSALIDEWRYLATSIEGVNPPHVLLLVADAREEAEAKRRAAQSDRKADALKRIGKALTMHQTLQPMSVAAAHAISAATELAAVLLWVRSSEDGPMELVASVGANRAGTTSLAKIDVNGSSTCVAEVAAERMKPIVVPNVHVNQVTSDLEAKFCYLSPGGLMVWPLIIGSKLVGLLEVVSRDDDAGFMENQDLFATIAEHLSLALNSALMFENAERLAAFDPLTGIANHRTMQEFLHKRFQEAERSNGTVGVIMLDVDHFRTFNEEEGHDAGDRVLKLVAEVLKTSVRPYDLAARYGGEEFTIVMPGVEADVLFAAAERIRTSIERIEYVSATGSPRKITASLGCAVYPDNANEPAGLLKAADLALYEAKRTTRNRSVLYSGQCSKEQKTETQSFVGTVRQLLPDESVKECEGFLQKCQPLIARVTGELSLSMNQKQVLECSALLLPYWRRIQAANDQQAIKKLSSMSNLTSVLACLTVIDERFDGNGPRKTPGSNIPLLARVLAVMTAVSTGVLKPGLSDPGKYDPDVVELILGSGQAA